MVVTNGEPHMIFAGKVAAIMDVSEYQTRRSEGRDVMLSQNNTSELEIKCKRKGAVQPWKKY